MGSGRCRCRVDQSAFTAALPRCSLRARVPPPAAVGAALPQALRWARTRATAAWPSPRVWETQVAAVLRAEAVPLEAGGPSFQPSFQVCVLPGTEARRRSSPHTLARPPSCHPHISASRHPVLTRLCAPSLPPHTLLLFISTRGASWSSRAIIAAELSLWNYPLPPPPDGDTLQASVSAPRVC